MWYVTGENRRNYGRKSGFYRNCKCQSENQNSIRTGVWGGIPFSDGRGNKCKDKIIEIVLFSKNSAIEFGNGLFYDECMEKLFSNRDKTKKC